MDIALSKDIQRSWKQSHITFLLRRYNELNQLSIPRFLPPWLTSKWNSCGWAPPNTIQKERRNEHPTKLIAWLLTVSNTFNSLFKVLFTFPSWYLCSIDLPDIFSFGRTLAPIKTALPSSPTLRKPFVRGGLQAKDRAITCRCITSQWTKTSATLWTNFHTLHLTTQEALWLQDWTFPYSLAVTQEIRFGFFSSP